MLLLIKDNSISMSHGKYQPASETTFIWPFTGGPLVVCFSMLAGEEDIVLALSIFPSVLCHYNPDTKYIGGI